MADETMDVAGQIDCLNRALALQQRSVLQYSLVAGSVIGLEYQAHADKMRKHAVSELEDATRLVEKIAALGGEPTTQVAELRFAASEAVEHRLEHMIMRKQEQVDYLLRARRHA
jgi:bacterioferritin (cytochrome b1)